MGKALVIPDCSFVHVIGQVTFTDVHCTGISLDVNALNIRQTETATIKSIVTPDNTTDMIIWSTSDDNVASVANGIVTAKTEGTATITATCGEYSASCEVTVATNKLIIKGGRYLSLNVYSGVKSEYATLAPASGSRGGAFGSSIGKYKVLALTTDIEMDNGYENIYPYPIPHGATKIHVSCLNAAPVIVYYNSTVKGNPLGAQVTNYDFPKVITGETASSGTEWSIETWSNDQRTFDIPEIDGIDSFTLGFYSTTSTRYTNFDPESVAITFE